MVHSSLLASTSICVFADLQRSNSRFRKLDLKSLSIPWMLTGHRKHEGYRRLLKGCFTTAFRDRDWWSRQLFSHHCELWATVQYIHLKKWLKDSSLLAILYKNLLLCWLNKCYSHCICTFILCVFLFILSSPVCDLVCTYVLLFIPYIAAQSCRLKTVDCKISFRITPWSVRNYFLPLS